jgi:hypothetical protein
MSVPLRQAHIPVALVHPAALNTLCLMQHFNCTHYVRRQTDTHRVCYVIRTPARYFFIQFENWSNDVMVTIICELRIQMKCAARRGGVESNYQLCRNARLWAQPGPNIYKVIFYECGT